MNRIDEIRHANLLTLLREVESAEALAARIGVQAAYISQLKNRTRHSGTGKPRSIGTTTARRLEVACGKPAGWMDNSHDEPTAPAPADIQVGGPVRFVDRKVPIVKLETLGSPNELYQGYDALDPTVTISCPVQSGPNTFAVEVDGESMYQPGNPESIPPGFFVYVDPDRPARHHNVVAATTRGKQGAILRRLVVDGPRRYLEAINPAWPQRIVEIDDDTQLLGVVVYIGRRMV